MQKGCSVSSPPLDEDQLIMNYEIHKTLLEFNFLSLIIVSLWIYLK